MLDWSSMWHLFNGLNPVDELQEGLRCSRRRPFCCAGANTTSDVRYIAYLVTVATKPMNVLSLIQRQQQKKQALQAAQNAIAKTANLCYRGVCYTR